MIYVKFLCAVGYLKTKLCVSCNGLATTGDYMERLQRTSKPGYKMDGLTVL